MSAERNCTVVVTCDDCGLFVDAADVTIPFLRNRLRNSGWRCATAEQHAEDFCPACLEPRLNRTPKADTE